MRLISGDQIKDEMAQGDSLNRLSQYSAKCVHRAGDLGFKIESVVSQI